MALLGGLSVNAASCFFNQKPQPPRQPTKKWIPAGTHFPGPKPLQEPQATHRAWTPLPQRIADLPAIRRSHRPKPPVQCWDPSGRTGVVSGFGQADAHTLASRRKHVKLLAIHMRRRPGAGTTPRCPVGLPLPSKLSGLPPLPLPAGRGSVHCNARQRNPIHRQMKNRSRPAKCTRHQTVLTSRTRAAKNLCGDRNGSERL